MEISEAIKHALNGEAVLLLGAGFSFGCKNMLNEDFPMGNGLTKKLYSEIGISPDENLHTAAEMYIDKFGSDAIIELFNKIFTANTITNEHIEIGKIEWNSIYTTNYDNVIEKIFHENGIKKISATCADDTNEKSKLKNLVLHINGFIDFISYASLESTFKLTDKKLFNARVYKLKLVIHIKKRSEISKVGYSHWIFNV